MRHPQRPQPQSLPKREFPERLLPGVLAEAHNDVLYSGSIKTDDRSVREFCLEALRETLALTYPSYILAPAMGAGKTILSGAIFATEFAMSVEYPDGPFVQNALVFPPGKTEFYVEYLADHLKYELVYTRKEAVGYDQPESARQFVEGTV